MCCWIGNIYKPTDNSSCLSPIQRQAYVGDLEMFSILTKINAYEDISGKKDGNLKTLNARTSNTHFTNSIKCHNSLNNHIQNVPDSEWEFDHAINTWSHSCIGIVWLAISIYCNIQKSKQCHGLNCVFIELLSLVDPSTQDELPRTKLGGSISQIQCNRAVITIQTEVGLCLSCSPVIAPGLSQALGSCYPICLIIPDITTVTTIW
jgi:hypothetical protein